MSKSIWDIFETGAKAFLQLTCPGVYFTKELCDYIDHLKENELLIANVTDDEIAVVVSSNLHWVLADFSVNLATLIATEGGTSFQAIKSAQTVKELYDATKQLRAAANVALKIWEFFNKNGLVIKKNKAVVVNKKGIVSPFDYLNPSGWAAVCGASDLSIIIASKKGQIYFNSNSDESWIVLPEGCKKLKKGSKSVPKKDAALHSWD